MNIITLTFLTLKKIKLIAEIGINHNGEYDKAESLILKASEVGADAIKFQYRSFCKQIALTRSLEKVY